ncbi:hypothetical protein KBA27_00765 [bacterium]|nr:hypothetical protein [bacterium]
MKISNNTKKLAITLAFMATCSSAVFAADAFTPLNFDDNATAPATSAPKSKVTTTKAAAKSTPSNISDTATKTSDNPIGNDNIQNAILELDNAQVGIRNDLLNYKAKYSDVDAQYKLIKNERNMLHKQVKSIEKRIKELDRAKDKIRHNML